MSNNKYLTKLKNIIFEHTGIDKEEISADSYFKDDLNIGEMELIEIIGELEEEYQIDLSEVSEDFETIQDVVDALEEYVE